MKDINIQRFSWNIIDANSYLITEGMNGLLIDAVDSKELLEAVKNLDNLIIILTHCHYDHIGGINEIRKLVKNVHVYSTRECGEYICLPERNLSSISEAFMAFYFKDDADKLSGDEYKEKLGVVKKFSCEPADIVFDDEMEFEWEGHKVNLTRYYGHSNDSLIAIIDDIYVFSGDTILGIPTATRLPKGNTKKFWLEDIPRLMSLTDTIVTVFPGHGDSGKLSSMIDINERPDRLK